MDNVMDTDTEMENDYFNTDYEEGELSAEMKIIGGGFSQLERDMDIEMNEDNDDDEVDARYNVGQDIVDGEDCLGLELRYEDGSEEKKLNDFLTATCGCTMRGGSPCSKDFTYTMMTNNRADMLSLTKEEMDIVILTQIRMSIDDTDVNAKGKNRKNSRCKMTFKSKPICIPSFLMLHAIGERKFYTLINHFKSTDSILPRQHGNSGRLPRNALSHDDIVRLKTFLLNYAEDHAVLLPGAYPGFKNLRTRLLESHTTKAIVWEIYNASCVKAGCRVICYSLFVSLWKKLVPFIVIAKPRTDLCNVCQENNMLILRTTNVETSKKLEKLSYQEEHLYHAERERLFYKRQCKEAKEEIKKLLDLNSNTLPESIHISFDFAQQIHYPAPPDQPGALFFLTPRKCGLFGICNDGKYKQINYLIDECVSIGKGPDCIVSLVHHYLENYATGIREINIHADNCVGQNKNNYVLQYFLWRILTKKNSKIHLAFMIAGHTKFSCDALFGMIKKVTRREYLSCLADFAKSVIKSTPRASSNDFEIVGLENEELMVPYYNWKDYLPTYFRPLPDITKYHHFDFSELYESGCIKFKQYEDSTYNSFNVMKFPGRIAPLKDSFPEPIVPTGMSDERKAYLYNQVRPYCRPGTADIVAPLPTTHIK